MDKLITIVSGLPRSGTSLMMYILESGGLPLLTDNLRQPDVDNPNGYFEFEPVKRLYKGDTSWLPKARGKVVKIIATLLPYLPRDYQYRVIFVKRDLREILASQKNMLINKGEDPDRIRDAEMAKILEKHLAHVKQWFRENPKIELIAVNYNRLIEYPGLEIARINKFFGNALNEARMAEVIDINLYRQRILKPRADT